MAAGSVDGGGLAAGGVSFRFRPRPDAGSDLLVVVFSQVRVPDGKFGLERLFAATRHACLFLNQAENRWYRGAETAIDAAIARALSDSGARRLVLYGSSMGAYGALATARRWPEARVVAFAPDFAVGEAMSRSAAAGLAPMAGEGDLGTFLAAPRSGIVEVAIGLFDPYDVSVACRLAGVDAPWLRLMPVASGHELHDHLYSVNVIRKLIGGFCRDLATEAERRGLLLEVGDWRPYGDFARLAGKLDQGELDRGELPADDRFEIPALAGNPGLLRLRAEAAIARGDRRHGIALIRRLVDAIAADPVLSTLTKRYRKEIWRRLIGLLEADGQTAAAREAIGQAARLFPEDGAFQAALSDGASGGVGAAASEPRPSAPSG